MTNLSIKGNVTGFPSYLLHVSKSQSQARSFVEMGSLMKVRPSPWETKTNMSEGLLQRHESSFNPELAEASFVEIGVFISSHGFLDYWTTRLLGWRNKPVCDPSPIDRLGVD